MNEEDKKKMKELADALCEFCPFMNGEADKKCDTQCDGYFCEQAYYNYLESKEEDK